MTTHEMQERILELKAKKGICILAHSYQSHQVTEIADYTGDSFGLAERAQVDPRNTLLVCGVRFMAETVKILSPDKRVILSHSQAGCPMAEQMTPDMVLELKRRHLGAPVVAYVNTTAELKAVVDVCVTSSSALQIVSKIPEKDIIFIPDKQLGSYIASCLPDKNIILFDGGCPTHYGITAEQLRDAKRRHPAALLLVHPECSPEIVRHADYVGSTAGIMDYARASDAEEFIIGTENSIVAHLSFELPDKRFYPLSKHCVCYDMSLTTLPGILACLEGKAGEEIVLTEHTLTAARSSIEQMLILGA